AGDVTVSAEVKRQSNNVPDYHITAADKDEDTVTVANHGLVTGDVVEYDAGGNPSNGRSGKGSESRLGANNNPTTVMVNRTYGVIRIDDNKVAFGNEFNGSSVDSNTEIITFDHAHNFVSGDQVKYYRAPGTSSDLDGLSSGVMYYVLVIN